jgi:hypothetical protein
MELVITHSLETDQTVPRRRVSMRKHETRPQTHSVDNEVKHNLTWHNEN